MPRQHVSGAPARRTSAARVGIALACAGMCAGAVTGCSTSAPRVEDVVTGFFAAVSRSDGAAACERLAPAARSELESSAGTSCRRAVLQEVDPATGPPVVEVYGGGAQARVGDDTAFLAEFRDGWLITAVGCTSAPHPDRPFDCTVHGG